MKTTFFTLAIGALAANSFLAVGQELQSSRPHVFRPNVGDASASPADSGGPLVYHGGGLITNPKLVDVFWGPNWFQDTSTMLSLMFENMTIASSMDPVMTLMRNEYSVTNQNLGTGGLTSEFYQNTHPLTFPYLTDPLIQSQLQSWITGGQVPQPDAHTIYNVYTEPSVCVVMGSESNCSPSGHRFCGYHSSFQFQENGSWRTVVYAVVPYANMPGCNSQGTTNSETLIASHEIYEAITNPVSSGWYDSAGSEIGDKCSWQPTQLFGLTYQKAWSNLLNGCFPL